MRISEKMSSFIRTAALAFIIMSCTEISAQPEAKTITIQVGEQDPDGCQLLGKVKGSSKDNQINEGHILYIDRLMHTRNNLRNEAQKLGGNTLHIIYANNSGKYEIPGVEKEIILIGNVYRCG